MRWILIINIVALPIFGLTWLLASHDMGASLRVTELDRNQIIDEAKLREYRPDLAVNMRHDLGLWIAESQRVGCVRLAQAGLALSAIQILVAFFALKTAKRPPHT